MKDSEIVELYWRRSESAILETDKKYGRYCHYIANNILSDGGAAEEIVDDTYLKLWESIPPSRPEPLKPYIGAVTRNLAINRYMKMGAKKRGSQVALCLDELGECIPDGSGDGIGESLALSDALNRFLAGLGERERRLFVGRYWYAAPLSLLARDNRMTEGALSVLLWRVRSRLKEFLEKENISI